MQTAGLIDRIHSSDHITDALISLHWLRVPERMTHKDKVAVLTYRALTGDVPQYLQRQFIRVAFSSQTPVLYF